MCFVPMNFGFADRTILKSNGCFALHFPPVAAAVQPSETPSIAKTPSSCDRLYRANLSDNLDLHAEEDYLKALRRPGRS